MITSTKTKYNIPFWKYCFGDDYELHVEDLILRLSELLNRDKESCRSIVARSVINRHLNRDNDGIISIIFEDTIVLSDDLTGYVRGEFEIKNRFWIHLHNLAAINGISESEALDIILEEWANYKY